MNSALWAKVHSSVKVDETTRIYGRVDLLEIGEGSRIDAFCVITVGPKGVKIGRNVHVGCGVYIFGGGGRVEIGDRCSLSPRSTIYTACDDFRKAGLIGPTNPREQRNVIEGDVIMGEESALGHGAILFPTSVLGERSSVAAYCVVHGYVRCDRMVYAEKGFTDKVRGTCE